MRRAGVVDDDVEPAGLHRRVDHRLDVGAAADVAGDGDRAQLPSDPRHGVAIAVRQNQLRAFLGEKARDPGAEPGASTRHQGHLACQPHRRFPQFERGRRYVRSARLVTARK